MNFEKCKFLFFMVLMPFLLNIAECDDSCPASVCCQPGECCDGKVCDRRIEASDPVNTCIFKCGADSLAVYCNDIEHRDTFCFRGAVDEDNTKDTVRTCYKVPINEGQACAPAKCQNDDILDLYACYLGKCRPWPNECTNYPKDCMDCKCDTVDEIDQLVYTPRLCPTGKHCLPELDNCVDLKYCSKDSHCIQEPMPNCVTNPQCVNNLCEYDHIDCGENLYCDPLNGQCKSANIGNLNVCRIESEEDYTVYEDCIYFTNPEGHAYLNIQKFEIQAGKDTHDHGDWVKIGEETYPQEDYEHCVNPVEKVNFRPSAYRVGFVDNAGSSESSSWETEIVRKKDHCSAYLNHDD